MSSKSVKSTQWEYSAQDRIARIVGAGLATVIVVSSSISAFGQQAPRSPAQAQGGAPPQTVSPVLPAPAPAEAMPQPGTPLSPAAAPSASDRPETPVPAAGTPAAAEQPTDAPSVAEQGALVLPKDLTPYGMFMSADIIVKVVMVGLMFASVLTWTIWLAKTLELLGVRRRLNLAQRSLRAARSIADPAAAASEASPHVALLFHAVEAELARSSDRRDIEGIKERITARFERIEAGVGRKMMRATGILATIGATAPFVGLFGTVWGIMNSFIGISKLHTTNLAVVAPGIAEALLATAFGLAAAIPAVVIYNMFARSIANYRALYADASVEILTLVSRDLSQPPAARHDMFDARRRPAAVPMAE
jgi:biopolymer transport protein ExbB